MAKTLKQVYRYRYFQDPVSLTYGLHMIRLDPLFYATGSKNHVDIRWILYIVVCGSVCEHKARCYYRCDKYELILADQLEPGGLSIVFRLGYEG